MSCYCGRTWNAHILVSIFFHRKLCFATVPYSKKRRAFTSTVSGPAGCFCFDCLLLYCFRWISVKLFLLLRLGTVWAGVFSLLYVESVFLDSVLHCSDALSSWKVATYSAGGRSVGRLYPPGFAGRCSFDLCVSCQQALLRGASGPVFRGAALLDFCVKPQGDRPTFVWEHVAKNPRVLGLRLFVLSIGCSRGASCASRSFLRQWGVGRLFVFSCGFCTFGCFRVEKCRWRRRFGL